MTVWGTAPVEKNMDLGRTERGVREIPTPEGV